MVAVNQLSKVLCSISKELNARFYLRDKPISYEEVFSDTGVLPAIAKRADQLCSLCLGYGIGVTFTKDENTTTGNKVHFDDATPMVLRLLCLTDIIDELVKNSSSRDKVALDEFLYD